MRRLLTSPFFLFASLLIFASCPAIASEYYGQVTIGGIQVSGATVTTTQGAKSIAVTTDERGLYRFTDLADGNWKTEISRSKWAALFPRQAY